LRVMEAAEGCSLSLIFIVGCFVGLEQAGKTCPGIIGISCR
jgi:hypothetical protein